MSSKNRRSSPKIRAISKHFRMNQSYAERRLWKVLRNRQIHKLKWRRQHPIGNYIVDFYCAQHHLVLEVDGDAHAYRKSYDDERTNWLTQKGYHILRFANRDVVNNIDAVVDQVIDIVDKLEK